MNMKAVIPLFSVLAAATATGAVAAVEFPPISDAERALTAVPGQPGAPAVVLFKNAEMRFMDYPEEVSSSLKVDVRIKILTEEGKDYGEVEIYHSGYLRLKKVDGRTVLADGSVLPLPEDAVFEERRSRSLKYSVTKLVFPAVEVGAILDYSYTQRWDDFVFLEPWYFQSEIPVQHSEITYIKPPRLAIKPWNVQLPGRPLQSETDRTPLGIEFRVWAEDLPGVPDEPFSPPFEALSSRFMMVPTLISLQGQSIRLLESWETTCELYEDNYSGARRKDREAKNQAAQLASGARTLLDKIAAIHAFVRDEVRTEPSVSIGVSEDEKVDRVLQDRSGRPVAKALLLQSMLEVLKLDSELVWVADRTAGTPDLGLANPWWFDAAVVRVEVDGRPIYLDPADRSVGFGRLPPYYEATQGLLFHRKHPQVVDLPESAFDANLRRALVDLKIDQEGRVTGKGTLELEGHQAWRYLRWHDDAEATREAWQESLAEDFEGYRVEEVEVEEKIDDQYVRVGWSLRQRDEDVLGDEVSVRPSRPVGPITQPFSLPPNLRLTPVQLLYPRRDEVVMTLQWPEGWEVDLLPEEMTYDGQAGKVEHRVEHDEAAGKVTYRRRFDVIEQDFRTRDAYEVLRELYEQAVKADAQNLVLVRE